MNTTVPRFRARSPSSAPAHRLRRVVDQAIARLTAMLDAGRVSRTELRAIVEALRAAVDRPSGDGGARRADDDLA